ncbi:MAG: hypothetical protein MPN21_25155 [Thermoanaerobaculia bacterium]|nr:hypothetical protein [Thermoanaerobaculia bacterium]
MVHNAHAGSSLIADNVIANNSLGSFPVGMSIRGNGQDDDDTPMPIDNVTLRGNVIHGWGGGLLLEGSALDVQNVTLDRNILEGRGNERVVNHFGAGGGTANTASVTSLDNRFWNQNQGNGLFEIEFGPVSFETWQAEVGDTTSTVESPGFPDPDRDIARYHDEVLGAASSYEAFVAAAREQRRGNWQDAYTARAVNDWVRQGFDLGTLFADGFESGTTSAWSSSSP